MATIFKSLNGVNPVYSSIAGTKDRIPTHPCAEGLTKIVNELLEEQMWVDIRKMAKTNITLQDAVDRVIMIYKLSKEHKDGI
jgi:hypothetical protein